MLDSLGKFSEELHGRDSVIVNVPDMKNCVCVGGGGPEPLSPSPGSERSCTDTLTRFVSETHSAVSSSVPWKLAASPGRNALSILWVVCMRPSEEELMGSIWRREGRSSFSSPVDAQFSCKSCILIFFR